MKAKRKKTKKAKKETIPLKEPTPPAADVIHEDKPQFIKGTVMAVLSLIGVISLINLLKKPTITGAIITTAEIERNFNFTILITVIIIFLAISAYAWGRKKFY
jgi:hypothetical protein